MTNSIFQVTSHGRGGSFQMGTVHLPCFSQMSGLSENTRPEVWSKTGPLSVRRVALRLGDPLGFPRGPRGSRGRTGSAAPQDFCSGDLDELCMESNEQPLGPGSQRMRHVCVCVCVHVCVYTCVCVCVMKPRLAQRCTHDAFGVNPDMNLCLSADTHTTRFSNKSHLRQILRDQVL